MAGRLKSVRSDDPRKAEIVTALKKVSGATRITSVEEWPDGTFTGNCLRPGETHLGSNSGKTVRCLLDDCRIV